ncbi:MAG: LacI family DNA-binding transcriptional regulator [Opitutus sp.]
MLTRRPTMQDVARAGGVHQTTVSLALRNDPRLPAATRERLRALATKLGYAPDPMLSALNAYRSHSASQKSSVVMAFLAHFHDARELAASHPHRLFLEGARARAQDMGYRLEVFYFGAGPFSSSERLEKILIARGITGLIIGAFAERTAEVVIDWSRFSAVLIESQQLELSLHVVSNHQAIITRTAIRRLHALGYRRIGLAVGEREEIYLKNAFTAGYYVEVAQSPESRRISPCLLSNGSVEQRVKLESWVRRHRLDAVLSNWHVVPQLLKAQGFRIPQDLVVASLDVTPHVGVNAGMRQNHRIVGERAAEQLAILMKTNQRGLVDSPNHTLVEGVWVEGSDVPQRPLGVRPRNRIRARADR